MSYHIILHHILSCHIMYHIVWYAALPWPFSQDQSASVSFHLTLWRYINFIIIIIITFLKGGVTPRKFGISSSISTKRVKLENTNLAHMEYWL